MIDEQQAGGVFVHLAQTITVHGMAASFVQRSEDLRVSFYGGDLLGKLFLEISDCETRQVSVRNCAVVVAK